eukprot:3715180-Amphidinium_carterae.1
MQACCYEYYCHGTDDGYMFMYGYWYAYYTEDAGPCRTDVCSSNVGSASLSVSSWTWKILPCVGIAWTLVFLAVLCALNYTAMGIFLPVQWLLVYCSQCCRCALGCCGNLRHAIAIDMRDIARAMLFMCCEVLFVLARRLLVGRASARKLAMRLRPYAAAPLRQVQGGIGVEVDEAYTPIVRRSLADIQVEYRMIAGGRSITYKHRTLLAGWLAGRRHRARGRASWKTTYNPRSSVAKGDCLFMVLSKYLGKGWSPLALRKELKKHAAELLVTGAPVHKGLSLGEVLARAEVSPTEFLASLVSSRPRWGNSIDTMVAAHRFQVNFDIYNILTRRFACCHNQNGPRCLIGYINHHFVAGVVRARRTADGQRHPQRAVQHGKILRSLMLVSCLVWLPYFLWQHAASTTPVPSLLIGCGWTAQTDTAAPRQFQQLGCGESSTSSHTVRNTHDLAIQLARQEFETECPQSDFEGLSCTASFADDERPLVMLLLRRIRRHLLAIAPPVTSRYHERLSAYRSAQHSPTNCGSYTFGDNDEDYDSDGFLKVDPSCPEDDRAYSLAGFCCTCPSISSSLVDSIMDCDTDYHPREENLSREAEYAHSHITSSICEATFPYGWQADELDSSSDSEVPSCLDSSRTLRMMTWCDSKSSLDPDDFAVFTPHSGDAWQNPLQLCPLVMEYWDNYLHEQLEFLALSAVDGARPDILEGDNRQGIQEQISGLQHLFRLTGIPREMVPRSPDDLFDLLESQSDEVSPPSPLPSHEVRERRFVMLLPDGMFLVGGGKSSGGQSTGSGSASMSRRPYPFGQFAAPVPVLHLSSPDAAQGSQQQNATDTVAQTDVIPAVTLLYHGSFAPFHTGHKEAIHCALRFLAMRGVYVTKAVLGFTTEDYVRSKTLDTKFADLQVRVEITRIMLADGDPPVSPITLDARAFPSATAFAQAHERGGSTPLYLVGSDLRKKPAAQTLIVTRTSLELSRGREKEFYDVKKAAGICLQKQVLNVTSTRVREALQRNKMPRLYNEAARNVIRQVLGWRLPNSNCENASVEQTTFSVQNSTRMEISDAHRRPTITIRSRDEVALLACSTNDSAKRKADNRPPLRRIRPCTRDAAEVEPVLPSIEVPPAPKADLLSFAGTMKLQPPQLVNLYQFWTMTATPLCNLLHVQPLSLVRRGAEGTIRLKYQPLASTPVPAPEIRFAFPLDVDELGRNLQQVANVLIYCACLSFDISGLDTIDFDPDTQRGDALRAAFTGALIVAARQTMTCTLHAAFVLFQEAQLIVFAKPLYISTAGDMADEVLGPLFNILRRHQMRSRLVSQNIGLVVNQERAMYMAGGVRQSVKCWRDVSFAQAHQVEPSQDSKWLSGGAMLRSNILAADVNPFLASSWYARVLWRNQWIRAYKARRLKKVVDNVPFLDFSMTDDCDIIHIVCTILDGIFRRLHCPVQLHWGRIQFYACSVRAHTQDFSVLSAPRHRSAYIRLMNALQSMMRALHMTGADTVHVFGLSFDGPITCWARWAIHAVVVLDTFEEQFIVFFKQGLSSLQPPSMDAAHLVHLEGGMRRCPKASEPTSSGHCVLFVPSSSVQDSLMHCVRWILSKEGWSSSHEPVDTHLHLRSIARMWLRNAEKQRWLCANQMVSDLADDMDCTTESFLEHRCDPNSLAAPAYVLVYALSCLYQVQMFVLDRKGCRMDTFIAASGWGLQWQQSTWVVTTARPQQHINDVAAPECIVISPTQPMEDSDVDSETLFMMVHGAGNGKRSPSPSAADSHEPRAKLARASSLGEPG